MNLKEKLLENLEYIGIFVGIILLTLIVAFLVNRFFKRLIRRSTETLNTDPTNYQFLRHSIRAIIYVVGFSIAIYMMPGLKILATSLLAGAGVLAVAVGFASQHALSNIISGVFIIIFKPFRIRDRLKVGDKFGVVEDISLRHTVLRDFENMRIIIPNAVISNEVLVNLDYVEGKICRWINIGISYDADLKRAKEILHDEILNHPLRIDQRSQEQIEAGESPVKVAVVGLGDSSVNLRGWAWAKDAADAFTMSCDLNESVKLRFDAEGIEIPFPHRTLVYKNSPNTTS